MDHKTIRIAICIGIIAGLLGCTTSVPGQRRPDDKVAMRQQEDLTLARGRRTSP